MTCRRALGFVLVLFAAPLAAETGKSVKKNVLSALKRQDAAAAIAAAKASAGLDSASDAAALLELLTSPELRAAPPHEALQVTDAIRETLVAMQDARARTLVVDLLQKKGKAEARFLLIDVVAGQGDARPLIALAEDDGEPDRVRVEAIRALGRMRSVAAVPPLIELVAAHEDARDLIWWEATLALNDVTGEVMDSAVDWRNFWAARPSFDPAKDRGNHYLGESETRDLPVIYGPMRRLVLLIDVSETMHRVDPRPGEPLYRERCSECDLEHRGVGLPKERSRMEKARRELLRVVDEMPGDVAFTIVAFSHDVVPFRESLMPANPNTKRQAVVWIESLTPVGTTQTGVALEKAFELCPDAEAFILISDGEPTDRSGAALTEEEVAELRARVRALNRNRRVRIDTIGFEGCDEAFMSELARENAGVFRRVKD